MLTISTDARVYALRELARRAAVAPSLFDEWRIELTPAFSRLWLDDRRFVQFPNADPNFWREIAERKFRIARRAWTFQPNESLARLVPEFIVPFANNDDLAPLFSVVDGFHAECSLDLLSSMWLTLSRFEETLPGSRDEHGRFTSGQSLAFANGFLNRPIVDEYGLAFEQILRALLPQWQPVPRELRVKLSHDVDFVGIPFRLSSTVGHLLRRRNPGAVLRDIASTFTAVRPAELESLICIAELAKQHGLTSAAYWKSSPAGPLDTWYNLSARKVQLAIAHLRERDIELGVHPGYETFLAPERLEQEVEVLRRVLHEQELGGRQHFLRWAPPTWQHWETCGLKYDSSVGYADHPGFRAGTCFPYRPWLLSSNREADLLEIPLLVMDTTLKSYMNLSGAAAFTVTLDCLAKCRAVGGVFTFLFHNDSFLTHDLAQLYLQLLNVLAGLPTYDWKTELDSYRYRTAVHAMEFAR